MSQKPPLKPGKAREKLSKDKKPPRAAKGMHDVLPQEQPWWDRVRKAAQTLALDYNFMRIDTPILELAELFRRGVGEETDLVEKEMYVVKTKGGDTLALRPEGTAPVMRAYLEHGLSRFGQPLKLYYEGPMFRHESPQAGRFREHTQAGFEILGGSNDPIYDAQIILIFSNLLQDLKIKEALLKINSIGCRICRPLYLRQLQHYYRRREGQLCNDCKRRLLINPLRILDCKQKDCAPLKTDAPVFLDKLCAVCSRHLQGVFEYLDELKIEYGVDNHLVRGLDYYSRTVFEFAVGESGVGALPAGGRYDYLAESLGGRPLPAVGGAVGFERLIHVMKLQEVKLPAKSAKKVFVIYVGDLAKQKALGLIERLREAGIATSEALGRESLKAQLRLADRSEAPLALILGQKEIYEERIIIRDLKNSVQEMVAAEDIVDEVKKRLKKSANNE